MSLSWRERNKEYIKSYNKKYKSENRELLNQKKKEWRIKKGITKKNRKNTIYKRKEGETFKEYAVNYNREWRKLHKNIDKLVYKKRKNDPTKYLKALLRIRIYNYLKTKGIKKNTKSEKLIGCKLDYVKEYLEKKFKNGMSWENHGKWHIDHIIPLSSAKNEEELEKLFHYTNLQPLWARENIIKSNKII